MRITRAIFFLAAATILWSGAAIADDADEARAAFSQGRDYFKAGEYTKAIEALQKAYALKPHPALLRFLGLTYYKMNKAKLAIAHFKRYLKEAPNAPDKDKVLAKVKELEMVVGASDDEEDEPPAPTPAPAPAPPTPAAAAPTKTEAPTGEDNEVPESLTGTKTTQAGSTDTDGGTSAMTVLKWVALGVGVGGLAAGGVFMGLAAGNASDLENAVIDSGNKDGETPKVAYDRNHHDMQESFKKNRTVGIAAFVVGGAAAVAAGVLFLLDRNSGNERASTNSNVAFAPVISNEVYGVAGQLRF